MHDISVRVHTQTHILTHTDADVRETCTLSSLPLGKDCRQQFLFIRLPAIWNQISPEDTMKLQIFSLPVHLPAKAHRINITTLSLSSCYKLARWWHFDQACVSPQSLTLSYTHTYTLCPEFLPPLSPSSPSPSDRLSSAVIHGTRCLFIQAKCSFAVPLHFSLLSQTCLIDKYCSRQAEPASDLKIMEIVWEA